MKINQGRVDKRDGGDTETWKQKRWAVMMNWRDKQMEE